MTVNIFEGKSPMFRPDPAPDAEEIQNLAQFFATAVMVERRVDAVGEWRHLWRAMKPQADDREHCPDVINDRETYTSTASRLSGILSVLPEVVARPGSIDKACATVRGFAYGIVTEPAVSADEVAEGMFKKFDMQRPRGHGFYVALAGMDFPLPYTPPGTDVWRNPITAVHTLDLDLAWPRENYLQIARELPNHSRKATNE